MSYQCVHCGYRWPNYDNYFNHKCSESSPPLKSTMEQAISDALIHGKSELRLIQNSEYEALQARVKELQGMLQEVIEIYDWCTEDPIDRGYSVLDDTIMEARATLAGNGIAP